MSTLNAVVDYVEETAEEQEIGQAENVELHVRKTLSQAREEARQLIHNWSMAAVAAGAVPLSGGISGIADQMMIGRLARCYEVEVTDDWANETRLTLALLSVPTGMFADLMGIVPIAGWVLRGFTLAKKTQIFGKTLMSIIEERTTLTD